MNRLIKLLVDEKILQLESHKVYLYCLTSLQMRFSYLNLKYSCVILQIAIYRIFLSARFWIKPRRSHKKSLNGLQKAL